MNISNSFEKRLQFLEEKFEYQDHTIEILNQVIIEMRKELDMLQEKYSTLKKELAVLSTPFEKQEDPPPPHY